MSALSSALVIGLFVLSADKTHAKVKSYIFIFYTKKSVTFRTFCVKDANETLKTLKI